MTGVHVILSRVEDNYILEGDRDNYQYLPQLQYILIKSLKLLPLWIFSRSHNVGSTATVGTYFENIRTIKLSGKNLRMTADEFLAHHILFIEGNMKLAAAEELSYEHRERMHII